jgi:thioredoxin-related protein
MLRLLLIFLFPLIQLSPTWESNFDVAKQRSIKENKIILIHFVHKSGDGKNVKLEKEVFETSEFIDYANKQVVLLKIDLGIEQTSSEKQFYHNAIIRERYNSGAVAPFTVITDADGKILKSWNYKQPLNCSELISSIQTTIEANKQ